MSDFLTFQDSGAAGYRLHKLEVYNWGTFDSANGEVHTVRPGGATTLLIGQNGSGKSTLVDCILTLLVRPGVRNYNVAAGAGKQERDERSYIKGACGSFSRDQDNHADVKFLRASGKQYSALLACFKNDQDDVFSLAQILYLDGENRAQKLYCFAQEEKSIAEHCANLPNTERLKQQMEKRGFKATATYTEYHSWFCRMTGVKQKAMDMFNQTVAVKDIQTLNKFIRDHMLEANKWSEKIEALQSHFSQLNDAHQSLVRVRDQAKLLAPVAETGELYQSEAAALVILESLLNASNSFFRKKIVDLFAPLREHKQTELGALIDARAGLDKAIESAREEERSLKNEIERVGGDRLRQIPLQIDKHSAQATSKREASHRLHSMLSKAGIRDRVIDDLSLADLQKKVPGVRQEIQSAFEQIQKHRDDKMFERATASRQLDDDVNELRSLNQRHGNLPSYLDEMRRQLSSHLRIPDGDLVFAAEVVAVREEDRTWESSAEMVLRGFALSLLVPDRHSLAVSRYIDQTKLQDSNGRGMRLAYHRVGERVASGPRPALHPQSLIRKLRFRDNHPLVPWVRAELELRFPIICCETVDEFHSAHPPAMTRERHLRWSGSRHEKDDRERTADPRNFVLGWENKEKKKRLAFEIEQLKVRVEQLEKDAARSEQELAALHARNAILAEIQQYTDFSKVNYAEDEKQIRALELEQRALEEGNDTIKMLKARLLSVTAQQEERETQHTESIRCEERIRSDVADADRLIDNAEAVLNQRELSGDLAIHILSFEALEQHFGTEPLTPQNFAEIELGFVNRGNRQVAEARERLEPLRNRLTSLMGKFLHDFRDEQADLEATPEYLPSFLALFTRIEEHDLPRHEKRFKERLNEKVIHEIGILNAAFRTEQTEISTKIDQLNQSLRQLEYRPGTYMKLEPKQVHDREIVEFQTRLKECLSGSFQGSPEADEARYLRIADFLTKLREDANWRERVTDVRRWFDFAARELDAVSGKERSYHEASSGQSGGEKAKLAFTILVAAIAYQYDLDPSRPSSKRFHFVVVDEMFSKVDDQHAEYALELFRKFGLQLLIVAPLDSKARVTEPYVGCYLHVVKEQQTSKSEIFSMTAQEFEEALLAEA